MIELLIFSYFKFLGLILCFVLNVMFVCLRKIIINSFVVPQLNMNMKLILTK